MLSVFLAIRWALMVLLYIWSALNGPAKVLAAGRGGALPRYCGRRGSGVDLLAAPAGDLELRRIQVVARHGARTPTGSCAARVAGVGDDGWACRGSVAEAVSVDGVVASQLFERSFREEYGSCEPGQLTDEGYAQHGALGAALRAAYGPGGRVGSLDARDVYVRASDFSRTRQSAEALVTALRGGAPTNATTRVETAAAADEWLYPNVALCPSLRVLEARAYADAAFVAWNATDPKIAALTDALRRTLGDFAFGFQAMAGGALLDCVVSNVCAGRPAPLDAETLDALIEVAEEREARKLDFNGLCASEEALEKVERPSDASFAFRNESSGTFFSRGNGGGSLGTGRSRGIAENELDASRDGGV